MIHFLPWFTFLIFVAIAPISIHAQQVKLEPDEAADLSSFGEAVDISGDGQFAIVGADGDDLHGENAGAAFIFVRDGKQYKQMARLAPADIETFDFFGRSVAISDDGFWAVAGAPGDDDEGASSGSAYVFSRISGSWKLQAKLTASDGTGQDSFGEAVAISAKGEYALVGAIRDDDAGVDAGSAYVFLNSGSSWKEQAKLTASNSADGLLFGRILTLSSDGAYALFGVENDEVNGMLSGSAYVFARTGSAWKEQAQIIPDDGAIQDFFGKAVSLNGDGKYALIGANGDDDLGPSSGSAYIYERRNDKWFFKDKLTASDGDTSDLFGEAVSMSLDGRYALVGASNNEAGANGAGSAYVFELSRDKWIEKAKIMADEPVEDGRMGAAIAISANAEYVIIGPRFDSADLTGGTYIFGGTTLPVDLTGFITTANADNVHLQWKTASEVNNAGFYVEQSSEGDWIEVAFLQGAGSTTMPQSYQYTVHNLFPGHYRFRLKQVDFDGAFEYSDVQEVTVGVSGRHDLRLAGPNPVQHRGAWVLTLPVSQHVEVKIYDVLGRQVARLHSGWLDQEIPLRLSWDAGSNAPGVYLIHIEGQQFLATDQFVLVR